MPDIVIKHLTAPAVADEKIVSKNPLFQYHGRAIPDMINDEIQEGALESDLDIDSADPHTNDDVDVGDPRTQLEIPITDEDSSTDVFYGQQYDFVVETIQLWDNPTSNLLAVVTVVTVLSQGWYVLYWIVIILYRSCNKLQPTTRKRNDRCIT